MRPLRALALALCVILVSAALAAPIAPDRLNAQRPASVLTTDLTKYLSSGELLMFVTNDGSFAYDRTMLLGKNDGLHYPRDCAKTVVFAAGLWLGAKVDGAVSTSCAQYAMDFAPGALGGLIPPTDPRNHVYLIRKGDTRLSNPDYAEWPFDEGAPVVKDHAGADSLDGDGYRIPLLKGDEATWAIFNDNDPTYRFSTPGTGSAGPLGTEIQLYAYTFDSTGAAGRTIYLEYKLISKGGYQLDSTYISFWADPDVGGPGDDLVGCDSLRSLGFCYNSLIDTIYGFYPPAVGVGLLNGPIVPAPSQIAFVPRRGGWITGYRNLPMTSFNKHINGTDPNVSLEAYNTMKGLYRDGSVVIDPTTGLQTTYMVSGDPLTRSGWLDEIPADRRQMISSGPFTMSPGDTQEVAIAVMVGSDYLHDCINLTVDTVHATHTAGTSSGSVFALILHDDSTTGHDYRVACYGPPTSLVWNLHDLTAGTTPIVGNTNFSGDDNYPILDGMMVKVIGSGPGVGGWEVPNGILRFSWVNGTGFGFEGFNGTIGWDSPCHAFGYCADQGVPAERIRRVLLKLADTDPQGDFDPDAANVSYAYRYLRRAGSPPAKPEFAPFIVNPISYGFQAFEKTVPLSAWDIDADPPRRLAIGFLENNVEGGTVNGKYWPPANNTVSNFATDGPREWLWIFDTEYSESPDLALQGNALYDPLPVMYFLTVTRAGNVSFATGDEFLIIPSGGPLTEADVFEFTAPEPTTAMTQAMMPSDRLGAIANLHLLDSLALLRYRAGITLCSCPCHADPSCDAIGPDIVDVAQTINVAFRAHPPESPGTCPRANTDVDCSDATDILDVVKVIDVAFRAIPRSSRFCNPCNQP